TLIPFVPARSSLLRGQGSVEPCKHYLPPRSGAAPRSAVPLPDWRGGICLALLALSRRPSVFANPLPRDVHFVGSSASGRSTAGIPSAPRSSVANQRTSSPSTETYRLCDRPSRLSSRSPHLPPPPPSCN